MRAAVVAVLALGLTVTASGAAGAQPGGRHAPDDRHKAARVASIDTGVTPDDLRFPHRRLREGSARQARLLAEPLEQMSVDLRRFLEPSPTRPLYAGGVVLASRHGVVAVHDAAGQAVRYDSRDGVVTELPDQDQVPVTRDTIFDLASVTKTFTTIAVMQQVEAGLVDLDVPVASYLSEFAVQGKEDVTVRHLLTHTGGLPAWLPLHSAYDTAEDRFAAVLAVAPRTDPGAAYVYSDLGLITLGLLVEQVTGRPLDQVVREDITAPLGMADTMFNPPVELVSRIAATEEQPWAGRPMIRGEVHDENAWSLGGVAGHAGLFSTAGDLAVLARTLLNGGRYGQARILGADTVRDLLRNENAAFEGDSHGLGFELDQRWYMDGMSSPVTFGHTGYTGTSIVIDPLADSFVVLLTNRVHPSREWGSNNAARRAVARDLARAVAVRPREGRAAWFSGVGDDRTVTLTSPDLDGGQLDFALWYDTEAGYDGVVLESSADSGRTWQPLAWTLDGTAVPDGTLSGFGGRTWHRASALVAEGGRVRWRYTSDATGQGRGVYVDRVRLDTARIDDALTGDGWAESED